MVQTINQKYGSHRPHRTAGTEIEEKQFPCLGMVCASFSSMNAQSIFGRLSLCVLGLLLWVSPAHAKTNFAASVAFMDVAAAVSASVDGDVVQLPPGSATWSSTLQITRAITLVGAGTNATILNGSGSTMVTISLSQDRPVRISRIFFNQPNGTAVPTVVLYGRNYRGVGTPITAFRIDRCKFFGGKRAINPIGWCYGLIDQSSISQL